MPRLKIAATGPYSKYRFRASGDVRPHEGIGGADSADGKEATGAISGDGVDVYEFGGVPLAFDSPNDTAWDLDLELDMGGGFAGVVPTDLNHGALEIRGKGHYRIEIPAPGMILRDKQANEPDQVMTAENTMAAGNVAGGTDSWRVWPPEAVTLKADQEGCEYRLANNEADSSWQPITAIRAAMDF